MDIKSLDFEGKTFEQAIIKAEDHFGLSEEELVVNIVSEGKSGILGVGAKPTVINVIPFSYISVYAEEFVRDMVKHVGVQVRKLNASFSNDIIMVELDTSNNAVLIGKNGRTLNSIIHLTTAAVMNKVNKYIKVSVDIANYKDARIKQLERLAHQISRQVAKTNVDAKLEPMNSYERRIIHEYLAKDKYVETGSEGEEPKRYVTIKRKKL